MHGNGAVGNAETARDTLWQVHEDLSRGERVADNELIVE